MGFPTRVTCLSCGQSGPFPCPATNQDESAFAVYGRYNEMGMFMCRACRTLNLMKYRLLFKSAFVGTISPDNMGYDRIVRKHKELVGDSTRKDVAQDPDPTMEAVTATLRAHGSMLNAKEIASLFYSGTPSALHPDELDRATRVVLLSILKDQTDIWLRALGERLDLSDRTTLNREVFAHVYDGFIVGRSLLGTHTTHVSYSRDELDVKVNVAKLLVRLALLKAYDLLKDSNEQAFLLLYRWGTVNYRGGLHEKIGDPEAETKLTFLGSLNGFGLAIAEHIVRTAAGGRT